jgi:hypothetical protein
LAIYVVGYDLHPTRGETYDDLIDLLGKIGESSWHCLDSTWLIKTGKTAVQIRDQIKAHLRNDDQVVVLKYDQSDANRAAWTGFTGDCQAWLKNNL